MEKKESEKMGRWEDEKVGTVEGRMDGTKMISFSERCLTCSGDMME